MKAVYRGLALFSLFVCVAQPLWAQTITVALASNALDAVKLVSQEFKAQYGHSVRISSSSTGKPYAQIINGAPFDIYLAANAREPKCLEEEDHSVRGSCFTYVTGQLSLCSQSELTGGQFASVLSDPGIHLVAIANPKTAPYGAAAKQVLESVGMWQHLLPNLIRGENISQTLQYFISGNVQVAFLAGSQLKGGSARLCNHCMPIEQRYYQPIRQQAVLIKRAATNRAASSFVAYLKSPQVKTLLQSKFGYGVE